MSAAAPYAAEACRLYILIALSVAAVGKGAAIGPFKESLSELFDDLGPTPIQALAWAVVGVEACAAIALAVGGTAARAGMLVAFSLFAVFTAVILVALHRRQLVQCNCFGGAGHAISGHDVARNLLLISGAGAYLLAPARSVEVAAWPVLFGLAVMAFAITTHVREIAGLLGPAGQGPA